MWDQLTRHHTPRAKALLGMSWICVGYGIAYTPLSEGPTRIPPGLDVLIALVPMWIIGGAWLLVGVAGFIAFLSRRRGAAVFAAQFGMFLLWTISSAIASLLGDPRAWVTAWLSGGLAWGVAYMTRVDPPMWWPIRLRRPKWNR